MISDEQMAKLEASCRQPIESTEPSSKGLPLCPVHECLLRPKRNLAALTGTEGEQLERAKMPRLYKCPHCEHIEVVIPEPVRNERVVANKIKKYKTRIADESNDFDIRPTAEISCPACKHHLALYTSRQMRSADEPETFFYECCECSHKWRED